MKCFFSSEATNDRFNNFRKQIRGRRQHERKPIELIQVLSKLKTLVLFVCRVNMYEEVRIF
jgi:hypothetical protein